MNHAKHKAMPAAALCAGNIDLGTWREGSHIVRDPYGDVHIAFLPSGRQCLIRNQRALDREYRKTRKYPSIMHPQVVDTHNRQPDGTMP